ncbi:MAG: type IV pilin-like G/H family protein, partial [Leptolyngbyaceae bacterium]|nr:type IV pilin-like G/H family protein [Leptolyngbyaceae bacterium]
MPHSNLRLFSKHSLQRIGLIGVLIGTVGLGAIACLPQTSDLSSNSTTTGPQGELDEVKNTLVGEWKLIPDPNQATGTVPRWVFTGNNQLIVLDLSGPGSGVSQVGNYSINTAVSPMQLDIIFPDKDELFFTIFELTNAGTLQVQKNDAGLPRPRAFDDEAVTLEKISDSTDVANSIPSSGARSSTASDPNDGAERAIPSSPASEEMAIARASEAKQTIAMVNRAQQAYFIEMGEFTQSPADLGIPLNLESEHYRYELLTQSNR